MKREERLSQVIPGLVHGMIILERIPGNLDDQAFIYQYHLFD